MFAAANCHRVELADAGLAAQAAGAAAYPPSLVAHHPVRLQQLSTMADGIAVPLPGDIPFAIVDALVDEVRTVSEGSLSRAILLMLERAKMLVEPAGAAAVAALMEEPVDFEPPVVAIVSGGNIDPLVLLRVVRHGLAAAGRTEVKALTPNAAKASDPAAKA
mgnify:CR=1 FL=1